MCVVIFVLITLISYEGDFLLLVIPCTIFLYFCIIKTLKMQVIKGKVEEIELPEKADILISEPMGEFDL